LDKLIHRDNNFHILLIPPVINPISTDQAVNFIPVGLLVLSSTLKNAGLRSEIYTPKILITHDQDLPLVAGDILSRKPRSLGFSTWCDSFPLSLLLAEEIKKINPDIPVIFGGPQASILAEHTLEHYPFVDFVLKGEADYTLPELVSRLMNGKNPDLENVPGLVYRDPSTKEIIPGPQDEIVRNLDQLPVPAYERIFHKSNLRIDAGRGCPYPCTYCTTNQFFSRKYRVKSPDRIIGEMEYCNQKLGVTGLGISHDMFTFNKEFIADFTGRLTSLNKARKDPFKWTCSARTDCVSEDILVQMKESGCMAMFFGIETGSVRIQKAIRKNLDPGQAIRMIRHATRLGIVTFVSYMAGFPGESRRDLNATLTSIMNVAIAGARPQITMLSILPGTPIYKQHVEKLEYDVIHSGFSMSYLTKKMERLVKYDKLAFSSFYYLPNSQISRKTYLFLVDLVNNIEQFLPTLILIREFIMQESKGVDLMSYIEKGMDACQYAKDKPLPELNLLTDSLKKYLEYLIDKGLPVYTWDIFQADFVKAYMIAKFEHYELTQASKRKYRDKHEIPDPGDMIRIVPYWKLITTHHYIYDYMRNPVRLKEKAKFRKGHYHYLILPISHRIARIIKVPRNHVRTYRDLKESTVEKFIRKNVVILGEDRTNEILRKMIHLGLVRIEQSN
jgi:radical SAM superfamily enzyme YgiQ (UPF0313 family)